MARHVAIKCTYNDGGVGKYVGFDGRCSIENMKRNIEGGRVWCTQDSCPCSKYYRRGFRGDITDEPCYESGLFRYWSFGAGTYHHGKKAGQAINLHDTEAGRLAILTTRFPDEPEGRRRIVGLFKIGRIEGGGETDMILKGQRDFRVRLPVEEARELYFWDFYRNASGGPRWGTGLVRYMSDEQVAGVLQAVLMTARDERTKTVIRRLVAEDFADVKAVAYERRQAREKRVRVFRKYGSGGEGEDHKRLKRWVYEHPAALGLAKPHEAEVEYGFCSGDLVDVTFRLAETAAAVVEVEIDSYWTLGGAHQALKYRTLMCAELGLPIDSPKVKGFLVAPEFSSEARAFCRKYGITCYEKKP
jgi:hypothetical protein